jgi:hypothetical protein
VGRAQAFIDSAPMTEPYLVTQQNLAITNPLERDLEFRNRQNWLRGPGSGVLGITYVPPAPELVPELMQAIMDMLNEPDPAQSPLVIGAMCQVWPAHGRAIAGSRFAAGNRVPAQP